MFICSRNQWRSPTGERVWNKSGRFVACSAGTSPRAKRVVNEKDVIWADIIFVMENKHKNRLNTDFRKLLCNKHIVILDIPDEYKFMDPELVSIFEELLQAY